MASHVLGHAFLHVQLLHEVGQPIVVDSQLAPVRHVLVPKHHEEHVHEEVHVEHVHEDEDHVEHVHEESHVELVHVVQSKTRVEAQHENLHHVAPCSHVIHLHRRAHAQQSTQCAALLVIPLMPLCSPVTKCLLSQGDTSPCDHLLLSQGIGCRHSSVRQLRIFCM